MKTMYKIRSDPGIFMIISIEIILFFIMMLNCSQKKLSRSAYYPELVYPEGYGTFILFSTKDDKFFLSNPSTIGEAGNREELTSRIRMFLNIIEEDYHNLRITEVDIAEDRPTVNRFQVYDIPTLVLVNKYGHEVKRWMPVDFEISGGSITILQKEIDKLIKETETDDS
jgi:hypothetical protein